MATTTRELSRRGERGFTLVELIAYLGIFTTLTATMVGAELSARKMNRAEATTLEAMYTVDRIFRAIEEDCDRATRVTVQPAPKRVLEFTVPDQDGQLRTSTYKSVAEGEGAGADHGRGKLYRDGKVMAFDVHHVSFFHDPEHPRLVKVQVHFERSWGASDEFHRGYERTFLIRNLEGDIRGGL